MLAVKVPTDAAVLAPSLKIDLGTTSVTSAFTVANQLDDQLSAGTGTEVAAYAAAGAERADPDPPRREADLPQRRHDPARGPRRRRHLT